MEVFCSLIINDTLELEFDITDEDGIHSFGSSSQLVRMHLDEEGKAVGMYRIGIVCDYLLYVNPIETYIQNLWILFWS